MLFRHLYQVFMSLIEHAILLICATSLEVMQIRSVRLQNVV